HKFEIAYRASRSLASTAGETLHLARVRARLGTRETQWRDAVGGCGNGNQPGDRMGHSVSISGATFFALVRETTSDARSRGRSSSGFPASRGLLPSPARVGAIRSSARSHSSHVVGCIIGRAAKAP